MAEKRPISACRTTSTGTKKNCTAQKNVISLLEFGIIILTVAWTGAHRRRKQMSYLLDDVVRVLASPMPRRSTFKLLGGVLAGGILGSLGVRPAYADQHNNNTGPQCGFGHCRSGEKCCTSGLFPFCVDNNRTCCGLFACSSGDSCCGHGFFAFCGDKCCGPSNNIACSDHKVCCATAPFCVSSSKHCSATTSGDNEHHDH